ncbi:MAG TPA: hypothetical protein DGT21_09220, partial [Armatimonadetes bacterium]|nr:hypothetical protein [Armatimonadota bacterium]
MPSPGSAPYRCHITRFYCPHAQPQPPCLKPRTRRPASRTSSGRMFTTRRAILMACTAPTINSHREQAMQVRSAALGVVAIVLVSSFALAAEPIIVPFVTDPSPVIDGNLDEWANRGVLRELTGKEHATFSPESWKSNEDLSGWVRFGWDDDHLYVACHVVDDVFAQDQSAVEVWRGDHVMLTVDFIRSGDMQNVWQLGLSPGNLKGAGEAGPEIKPELVIWEPQGKSIEGGVVLAQRTPEGYDIE